MSGLFKQLMNDVHAKGDDYPGPWMLRADGCESDWVQNKKASPTVMSLSFPYFELGPTKPHKKKHCQSHYPLMSLYQWQDRTDAARQWDREQSYSQMSDVDGGKDQGIYLPHLWAIIVGNGILSDAGAISCLLYTVLFTYGPIAFRELTGSSIQQTYPKPEVSNGPDSVRIIDLAGCHHILDIRECCTYFVCPMQICLSREIITYLNCSGTSKHHQSTIRS